MNKQTNKRKNGMANVHLKGLALVHYQTKANDCFLLPHSHLSFEKNVATAFSLCRDSGTVPAASFHSNTIAIHH